MKEAELAMHRRLGASEEEMLVLLRTILRVRMFRLDGAKRACRLKREVFSGYLQLDGEEDRETLLGQPTRMPLR